MKLYSKWHLAVAAVLASIGGSASAAFVAQIAGNDCSGVFGQGFSNCKIPSQYDPKESPVVIKFNGNLQVDEINTSLFPTIDGSEFTFSNLGAGNGTGTWTYTPGPGDPGINWFVAKASDNFNLFDTQNPNSHSWITPLDSHGNPRTLSHLTFYDTGGGGPSSGQVPEPGSSGLALLGVGLLGATFWLRRRNSTF